MAAIFFDLVADTVPVLKIMNYDAYPNIAFIIIDGQNPGYEIGEIVKYDKNGEGFVGPVTNINVGGISASYPRGYTGVWVKTADFSKFNGYTGGKLLPGSVASTISKSDIISNGDAVVYSQLPMNQNNTVEQVVSAATQLADATANDVIIKEDGTIVGGDTIIPAAEDVAPALAPDSDLIFGLSKRTAILYGLVAIAGVIIITKLFK